MATNIEIFGVNATIPISCGDELKRLSSVNLDAEIIVKDIIRDILDTALRKSDEEQLQKVEENSTDTIDIETGDLIDLTRNYKQEFRTILQNLKCNTHNCPPTSNASLEEQIKKVIDEIKNLETSVRVNIEQEGRGDIENMSEQNVSSNPINYKAGVMDFLSESTTEKILPQARDEDASSEIVLQVMDLQEDNNSLINVFPSEEELEEVNLRPEDTNTILNHGDTPKSTVSTARLPNEELSAGETAVLNPVPDPEPDDKLQYPAEGKKKSIGKRLWQFIKKGSKTSPTGSANRKKDGQ